MKVRFEVTVEDSIVFHRHHWDHELRAGAWGCAWSLATMALLGGIVGAIVADEKIFSAVGFGLGAACLVVIPKSMWLLTERSVRRAYYEGRQAGSVGPHELELTQSELVERWTNSEMRMRLHAIVRVVTEGSHTFIFINAVQAIILPHDRVTEGNPEAFVQALRARTPAAMDPL